MLERTLCYHSNVVSPQHAQCEMPTRGQHTLYLSLAQEEQPRQHNRHDCEGGVEEKSLVRSDDL